MLFLCFQDLLRNNGGGFTLKKKTKNFEKKQKDEHF
jgi:hypothetical protein